MEDPPPRRVARWAPLFAEELAEVHRLAATRLLGDVELQESVYLAGRLLSTVSRQPSEEPAGVKVQFGRPGRGIPYR